MRDGVEGSSEQLEALQYLIGRIDIKRRAVFFRQRIEINAVAGQWGLSIRMSKGTSRNQAASKKSCAVSLFFAQGYFEDISDERGAVILTYMMSCQPVRS
jgi:hypothetical protein